MARNAERKRYLSLRWKLMLALSLVMLMGTAVLSWMAYRDQLASFDRQRAAIRDRHMQEAIAVHQVAAQRIQQLSDMLASLAGMVGLGEHGEGLPRIKQLFTLYWDSFQLNLGLEALSLFARDGRLLARWGEGAIHGSEQAIQAVQEERSLAWLDCTHACTQYAAAPILSGGQVVGAMQVAGSMVDMVGAYRRLSGLDVGLLLPGSGADDQVLTALGLRVSGLSNMARNIHILRTLQAIPPNDWVRVEHEGRYLELMFVRLDEGASGRQAPLLVAIEDVTAEYARIKSQAIRRLGVESSVSLLALVLLAYLLNAPMRRMVRVAHAMPLLGQRAFAEVRARVAPRARIRWKDEIDELDHAAVSLSYQLENLEHEVKTHADLMQDMLQRIMVERDFNQNLLDTAQVIILTQTEDGRLLTINRYGETLSGYSKEELLGRCFFREMCRVEDIAEADIAQVLHDIVAGRENHLYRECVLVSRQGTERHLAWSHTLLGGEARQVLSVGVDVTERKQAESRMVWLAEHDQLTGLANRQCFQRELEQALSMSRRSGRPGALLYMDLDGFKYVNDISGHQAGDVVLRMVAEAISGIMRDVDLMARLGGDEFGILLQECELNGAVEVAEKINRALAGMVFPGLGANHSISASIGIVTFPAGSTDVKQMLANADIAMYEAKASGRGRWHVFAEGERLQERLQRWVAWEERIKQGLEEKAFVLHYQPILDIRSNTISHFEALVRLRGENGTLIPPGEFIDVAEKSGLIRQLDRYVVHAVIDQLRATLASGRRFKFAVNLSGVSINDEGLLDYLRKELAGDTDLPSHLIFEITETAAVSDFAAARAFMQAVREMGCVFSLDDFGVGFSSFYYVKHLPVDYVKIDGSFIRTLANSPDDQVFVRALAEVARAFGKKTVAEFVEDERVLSLLRAYGVDYAQGYYIGKPGAGVGE